MSAPGSSHAADPARRQVGEAERIAELAEGLLPTELATTVVTLEDRLATADLNWTDAVNRLEAVRDRCLAVAGSPKRRTGQEFALELLEIIARTAVAP